jgi:hypothetical protein
VPASGSLNGRLQALSENKILDYPEKLAGVIFYTMVDKEKSYITLT